MDRETFDRVLKAMGARAINFASVVDLAAEMAGPLSWRDAAELALKIPHEPTAQAIQLLDFIAELARVLRPNSVLDPWVVAPTTLAAAHEASGASRSCGLIRREDLWNAAQRMASLDWRLGDPLLLVRDLLPEQFDLILVAPPLGGHEKVAPEQDDPGGRIDLADLVLWRTARMMADSGAVLFHTTDSFFLSKSRRNLCANLTERSLFPRAVISVDRALLPYLSAETSLVLFTREPRDDLFVGRLERETPVSALVGNLVAERTVDDPQLGAMTPAVDFRGWRPLVLEQQLGRMFGSSELRSLADIGRIRSVELKPGMHYNAPANCVFVPTLGFGTVLTVPPDMEGKRAYRLLEVELDPEVAQAEYVAGLLSSPPGRQLRESVSTGSSLPHLSVTGAGVIRLPVPPISDQRETLRSAAHLASMEATVARLRNELWRHPQNAARLITQLEAHAHADPVQRWLDTLPYPLASVLQRFSALRDPKGRLEALLHFYEATAQFGCTVLLSILGADSNLLALAQPDIASVAGRGRNFFRRAEFGLWTKLGLALVPAIARIHEKRGLQERLEEAAGPAVALMTQLACERIWHILAQARLIRNAGAHDGVVPPGEVASRIASLEVLLSEAEQALGPGFDDIDLVRVDQGRRTRGLHVYEQAQRLRGPGRGSVIQEVELRTRVGLESGALVFVGRDVPITPVLTLVPLVRVGGKKEASRNACYFFNKRLEDGRFKYVSYHFEDEAELETGDSELEQFLADLKGSTSESQPATRRTLRPVC